MSCRQAVSEQPNSGLPLLEQTDQQAANQSWAARLQRDDIVNVLVFVGLLLELFAHVLQQCDNLFVAGAKLIT